MPGLLAVSKDELRKRDTATALAFLGLTDAGGVWAARAKGESILIGIVNSGSWPEHPSFSDRTDVKGNGTKGGKLGCQQIPGWNGKGIPGGAFDASHCNQKLIGAQFFNEVMAAAGTHSRDSRGSVTHGNGVVCNGASAAAAVSAPRIDAVAAGLPGADPTALRLCFGATEGATVLDLAKLAGKIVVCDRGVTGRTNKSLAVKQAGGVGMVLASTSPNSRNADLHWVPTVHTADTDRAAVKAFAAVTGATGSITGSAIVTNAPAPFTATFSSRGPPRGR